MRYETWTWSLAAGDQCSTFDEQYALLDALERERCGFFRYRQDAQRYVAAHAGLRQRLGSWLDVEAKAIRMVASAGGKPVLPDYPGCHFNLSHSGELATLVIADMPVGIDIEAVIDATHLTSALTAEVLTPHESACLNSLPLADRPRAFTEYWVCKEAVMKATGMGLHLPPTAIAVDPSMKSAELSLIAEGQVSRKWKTSLLPAPPGYSSAVAVAGVSSLVSDAS